jgi:hypothetical protein
MFVLIVGGDHLGNIPRELDKLGVDYIRHVTGRSGQKINGDIPETVDFIIVLYDYVNHNLANKIKKCAFNRRIPVVYAKRSWSSIYRKMKECQTLRYKVGLQLL